MGMLLEEQVASLLSFCFLLPERVASAPRAWPSTVDVFRFLFFLFFFLLSSLELSDTNVYAHQGRARLGTTAYLCKVVALKLRAVPIGAGGSGDLSHRKCL